MAPSHISNQCILHCHILTVNTHTHKDKNKIALPVSLRDVFDEAAVKIINFIQDWPLSKHHFNITLCVIKCVHKALLPLLKYDCHLKEKDVWLNWEMAYPLFSWNITFNWKNNWQTTVIQIWVSGRLCLANEWNKAETLRKNWQYLQPMTKFKLSSKN